MRTEIPRSTDLVSADVARRRIDDIDVPEGSFLVSFPGGVECSEAEGNESTEAELLACIDTFIGEPSHVEITVNGVTATDLRNYIVTTRFDVVPPDNLFGESPTVTMTKGFFMVLAPFGRGTHTLHASDEFAAFGIEAGITYTINFR